MTRPQVRLGDAISLETLDLVARGEATVVLTDEVRARIDRARAAVDRLAEGGDRAPNVYGVNTGFGALAETRIAHDQIRALQRNLVRSHACGVGPLLPREAVRAMMFLRAQTIAMGNSGARAKIVDLVIAMLERGVHPCIPSQGSVGASGDLAPLAHLALVLIGEGEAEHQGTIMPGDKALAAAGLTPVELEAKEGLAMINGTQLITAIGALAVIRGERLCTNADVVGAMSLEALKGTGRPFDPRVQQVRPHPGQATTAANLRALLEGSAIMESHRDCGKVQDPYSLRCMPQIHGATRDALAWARQVIEREIIASVDNPLVFVDERGEADFVSGGNFHGQPLAIALDTAAIAIAELANCAERRLEQLVNPAMSSGLPPFLAPRSGLDSGFMMAQVTAAALVSENKVLCHPSSVDSIPSSAGKEDHVSMGSISARKCMQVAEHVRTVLAIEAMVAGQGLDLRLPLEPGVGVRAAHLALREHVPTLTEDRVLHPDIVRCCELVDRGVLVTAAERVCGQLS
ncbi:histidine ammonia-lyase [Sandaracinus amylolyticus]|uniref:histidine ammonia-lyase n=1 Tax=Sandaracinus amylolyticus TaxID=927083 RepID=UPI001F0230DA|nr:histidine ammonia-lyase [Sandaracinus amylolyticus]UJR81949.1 Histidine ammonia-lyase [Sandaracinus amylolyticus]